MKHSFASSARKINPQKYFIYGSRMKLSKHVILNRPAKNTLDPKMVAENKKWGAGFNLRAFVILKDYERFEVS
jgi:hypothetical protein